MMIRKVLSNISQVIQNHHLILWILLLSLTTIILLFPIRLQYEYHAIESIYAFGNNFLLFGILYYVWLGILLLLLFSKVKINEWQRLALVCIFAIVSFGFWTINTPTGGHWDHLWQMGHIKYIQETGTITFTHLNLSYFQLPGFHITVSTLSEVSGLGIFETRILFDLFSGVLFAALLYLLFTKFLKNSYLSSLGVLLLIQGSIIGAQQGFWPGSISFLLLVTLLIFFSERAASGLLSNAPVTFIIILLFAVLTITYLPGSACFSCILLGIYILQKVAKRNVISLPAVILFLIMFIAWEIFVATSFYHGLIGYITNMIAGFLTPAERVGSTLTLVTPTLAWSSSIKFFWLAPIIGLGSLLGIWQLLRVRKMDSIEVLEIGGLLGVAVFFTACFFALPGQLGQGTRSLAYFPLFTIPIILAFLSRFSRHDELSIQNPVLEYPEWNLKYTGFHRNLASFGGWFRRHIFSLLLIIFFALSFPTFLIHQASISSTAVYSYECSAGEFIESRYEDKRMNLFSDIYTCIIYNYYIPEAHLVGLQGITDADSLLQKMNKLEDDLETHSNAIFVLSERLREPPHQPAVMELTDPRWLEILNRFAGYNKIYDNGYIEIYEHLAE